MSIAFNEYTVKLINSTGKSEICMIPLCTVVYKNDNCKFILQAQTVMEATPREMAKMKIISAINAVPSNLLWTHQQQAQLPIVKLKW